jgi:hypothetical protein
MTKPLLYRLFGVGKIPAQLSAELRSEVIVLLDEGISGSTTYLDFRAPGKYSNWRRVWFTGAIALTQTRLVGLQYSNPVINVPVTDERLRSMRFSVEDGNTLMVAFDPALFHNDWSGTIEYRFRTSQAESFLEKLVALRAGSASVWK